MFSLTSKKMISYYFLYLMVGTMEWYLFIYFILLFSNQSTLIFVLFLLWKLLIPDLTIQWINKSLKSTNIHTVFLLSFLCWGGTAGALLLDNIYIAAVIYVPALSFFRISYFKKISNHITDNQVDRFQNIQEIVNKICLLLAILFHFISLHYFFIQLFLLVVIIACIKLLIKKDENELIIHDNGKWSIEMIKKIPVQISLLLLLISSLEFFSIYLIREGEFSSVIFFMTFPITLFGFYLGEKLIKKFRYLTFNDLTFLQIFLYSMLVFTTNAVIFTCLFLLVTICFTVLTHRLMIYKKWSNDELFTLWRSQSYINGIGIILIGSLIFLLPIRVALITFILMVAILILFIIRVNNRNFIKNKLL